MNLQIQGACAGLEAGLNALSRLLPFTIGNQGPVITFEPSTDGTLRVFKKNECIKISFTERTHAFRGLGLYLEHACEDSFLITETPQFTTSGLMVDMSQSNAVMTLPAAKELLSRMAIMGLNTFYLYMEDSFTVESEPYFGYMRSRYSEAELRELDDFADALGITIIPCVQTLAHLIDVLKWSCYDNCKEDADTLLVGSERTYILVRNILETISRAFRSRKIHIGMDEAFFLGRGASIFKRGYRPVFEIMNEHLAQVRGICAELGIEPMIWSDMYITAAAKDGHTLGGYYAQTEEMPEAIVATAPRDLHYVYWDYYHFCPEEYATVIRRHRKFADQLTFAGGIWNWTSHAVNYEETFGISSAALTACKAEGVSDVFATTWGDDGVENNIFTILLGMQFYAEHSFHATVSEDDLRRRFLTCTGCNYDDFYEMTYLDNLYPEARKPDAPYANASRYLLYQDPLAGIFDKNIEGLSMNAHFERVYEALLPACTRNGDYNHLFTLLVKLADVLRLKSELGLQIKTAYDQNDRAKMQAIASDILPTLTARVDALRLAHREQFFATYKPLGWEIFDLRYGAVLMRLDSAAARLTEWLEGKTPVLEELCETRRLFSGEPNLVRLDAYHRIPSASRITIRL